METASHELANMKHFVKIDLKSSYNRIYNFIDASGWVISDVSFGFLGVSGLATSDPLTQMVQFALILRQFPSRQLNCVSSTQDKWLQKWLYPWVSLLILQQPITGRLLWWLQKLSFNIGRPLCSCFPGRDDVVIRLLVQSGYVVFFFPKLTIKKILYINIKLWLNIQLRT